MATTAANATPVGGLIGGGEDSRRLFVRLLGAALQHDLREVCRWPLPAIRERLHTHLQEAAEGDGRKNSALKQQRDELNRERYKWAELAMNDTVPADIVREKQSQLARQLATIEAELTAAAKAGVDTTRVLDAVIDLIAEPGPLYQELTDTARRTYNLAWFTKIYIDTEDDPTPNTTTGATAHAERTPFAEAIQIGRQLVENEARNTNTPGPEDPSVLLTEADPGQLSVAQGSTPNPWVELRGIEPRSSSVEPGLLRVQSALSLFSAPGLAQTPPRRAQSARCP